MIDHAHHPRDHGHGGHALKNFGAAFAVGTLLNAALVVLQIVYGAIAHSVALLADAAHNFGDVLGLIVAWSAYLLAQRRPTERYTYGFRSTSILAALFNAVFVLVATGAIAWQAIERLFDPEPVAAVTVMAVAAVGIVINGLTAWMLMEDPRGDLNIRGAYVHMLADAAVSAGVVVTGAVILLTGWPWADPLVSIVISAVIVWTTWGLLRRAVSMSLQAVPEAIAPDQVRIYLESLPGVAGVHDIHIWSMSTTETALTCHLVMPQGHPGDEFLAQLDRELGRQFNIAHPTIQIEFGDHDCRLAPSHIV